MVEYYKLLRQRCDYEQLGMGIAYITKRLADLAGCKRKKVKYKNGGCHYINTYSKQFDDSLTAQWFVNFQGLFFSKVGRFKQFDDCYQDIMNSVFMSTMQHICIDRIVCDETVASYVSKCIDCKVKRQQYNNGSVSAFEEYIRTKKKNFCGKNILLQSKVDDEFDNYDYQQFNDIDSYQDTIDYIDQVDTDVGRRLLQQLLNSRCRVQLSSIDKYVDLSGNELSDQTTKQKILDQWNSIKKTLVCNCDYKKLRYYPQRKVGYSFEENDDV